MSERTNPQLNSQYLYYFPPSSHPRRSENNQELGIKREPMGQGNEWICFNPFCVSAQVRKFTDDHPHRHQQACSNWIINVKQLGSLVQDKNTGDVNQLEFALGIKTMQHNLEVLSTVENIDWNKYLLSLRNSFIERVSAELDKLLADIRQKIDCLNSQQLLWSLSTLHDSIGRQTQELQVRNHIQYIIQAHLLNFYGKKIIIRCLDQSELQSVLGDAIPKLKRSIWVEKQNQTIPSLVVDDKYEQFRKFVLDDSPGSYNKLQQLASICDKACPHHIIRPKSLRLRCPFCTHEHRVQVKAAYTDSQLKMMKKEASFEVLTHCFNSHYTFMYPKYQLRKIKKAKDKQSATSQQTQGEVTLDQVIGQLRQGNYSKLQIIDRESGIANVKVKGEPATYCLEIVSRNNMKMARSRFLVTPDRKCTEFMINYLLVWVCLVDKVIPCQDARVESNCKDINRLEGLKQILLRSEEEQEQRHREGKFSESDQDQQQQPGNQPQRNEQIMVKREDYAVQSL